MPISADKGPYFGITNDSTDHDGEGALGDALNDNVDVPVGWLGTSPVTVIKYSNEEWRPYNSRNHNSEGQNILFVDSHADFARKPIAGIHNDNIYSAIRENGYTDQIASVIGVVADTYAPLTQTDAYLVP